MERDTGSASCEYPKPGRWLAFVGNDTGTLPGELRALRLEGENHSASISLSEGIPGDYFDVDTWSPDGRHMLAYGLSFENIDANYLFHVEFGQGLPTVQISLPGLPVVGSNLFSHAWASDSSRVLIQNSAETPETYLVEFTSAGPRTDLLFQDTAAERLAFCRNPRWFIREIIGASGVYETRLVDSENPRDEGALWAGTTTLSPDGHFLMLTDADSGIWQTTCEANPEIVHVSDRPAAAYPEPGFEWSADSRFVAVRYDDDDDVSDHAEIEVLDALNDFRMVFSAHAMVTEDASTPHYQWAPQGSRLIVLGASEPGAACEIMDVELAATPPQVTRRGSCPVLDSGWGVLRNGAIWSDKPNPSEPYGTWLLHRGADAWLQISRYAGGFTPDERFGVHMADDTISAFSLEEPTPPFSREVALPPETYFDGFCEGGLLLHAYQGGGPDTPSTGQLWWIRIGPDSIGTPVPLGDVSYVDVTTLQPRP